MSQFTLQDPLSDWRKPLEESLRAISPEVAKGFEVSISKSGVIQAAMVALRGLSQSERQGVWQAAFPGIANEVELAWHHLDPQVMARRDGGETGNGARFTFAPSPQEANFAFMIWLRKLLLFTGPYPDAGLEALVANIGRFVGQRDYLFSGHSHDPDAPAYLVSVVLGRQPSGDLSVSLADLLEDQLLGRRSGGSDRALFTAVFCSERPDLWKRCLRHLGDAGKEPAFLERLSAVPIGTQPGAVLHYLQTIRDLDLLRFESVAWRVRDFFGIDWLWKSHRRDDLRPWFEQWVARIEAAPGGLDELPEQPGECLLALWAEALFDGDAALARIEAPSSLGEDARIAAAHFLRLCPASSRQTVVNRYVTDPDLRVCNIVAGLLFGYGGRLPDAEGRASLFQRYRDYIKALPAKPELKPCPAPLPSPKLDLGGLHLAVATLFPDGSEREIEMLLPLMNSEARRFVVRRLNRYSLTEFDRKLEKMFHGSDPEDWRQWLEDHEGSQSMAQRRLLLKLICDRSLEVAEAAAKAVRGFHLTEDEIPLIRPVLSGRSEGKRLLVTRLLAGQSEALLRKTIPELLTSKLRGERVAALEVLRQLAEAPDTTAFAGGLFGGIDYQPSSTAETRAHEILLAALESLQQNEPPGFENAFELVDPRSLRKPVEPREHDVIIHSPVTLRLIDALDAWAQERAEVMVPVRYAQEEGQMVRLGDGQLPYISCRSGESREDVIARFPLAEELAEWWHERPADLRDPDGFDGVRLQFAIECLLDSFSPKQGQMRKVLFDCDKPPGTRSGRTVISQLIQWLGLIRPEFHRPEGLIDYLIDISETLHARLSGKRKNLASYWGGRLSNFLVRNGGAPRAALERLWALLRNRRGDEPLFLRPSLWHVVYLLREGIATEDELVWFLLGPRPFGDYCRESAFSDLAMASAPPVRKGWGIDFPAGQQVVHRVVNRIIDLELTRGEEPQPWSHAALKISRAQGASNLQRLLVALGKAPLSRPAKTHSSNPNVTRRAVLLHLIHVSHPAEEDTPESFAQLMCEAGISNERLLEIALMRPAWTTFIAHATGITGLQDAVGWIFAHTRSNDYQWEQSARELWAGELGFDTSLSAEELIEGAVDTEWFARAHGSVGESVWEQLYDAARFASSSSGHTRARLFADALLEKIDVSGLEERLDTKGDLNAARAIGLPPLPKTEKPRTAELLRRYGILQKLRVGARKSKPQRRASEIVAFEVGVRNLARRAGYEDTVRFEWAMECEAVADLSEATLRTTINDVDCRVVIRPDGTLAMEISKGGKPLAAIPAATKKHDTFKALKQRMDELKEQAARLRPALETLMVRAVVLPAAEWRKILAHPLAGPLVGRLLLADASGPLGFPSDKGLLDRNGTLIEWPAEATGLHLAHPVELLPAESWHGWQRLVFDRRIVQPFKQIFREIYLPTEAEAIGKHAQSARFAGHPVHTHQAFAILSKRGWIVHPDHGLYRVFRSDGLCAWLNYHSNADGFTERQLTIGDLHFSRPTRNAQPVSAAEVPDRVFSEALRDADLVISVAHASGAAPEAGHSSIEIRADLVRETCRMLELQHVTIDDRHARIEGTLGNYRVHLGSGVVHREPGGMLAMKSDPQTERGRLFLPFADDDPQGIEVLSRVLLLARDADIRDSRLAEVLRGREG